MRAITGVFPDAVSALEAAEELRRLLGDDRVNVLTPGSSEAEIHGVPQTEAELPAGRGMGAIAGGALGAAIGIALPGVGQVTALGVALAALLGGGGSFAGWKLGDALDRTATRGIPVDELYFYEDALRQGRSVVIALSDDESDHEDAARRAMREAGAESIDEARERWWVGLRDAQRLHYEREHGDGFEHVETPFRAGFEAALAPPLRGRAFDATREDLARLYPDHHDQAAFRLGYERGRAHAAEVLAADLGRPAGAGHRHDR